MELDSAYRTKIETKLNATSRQVSSGCVLYTGYHNKDGYGQISVKRKTLLAHRVAWMLAKGPITPDQLVCHTCDTPACVNVDHLFLETQPDNQADKVAKRREARSAQHGAHTHPDRFPGHRFEVRRGSDNPRAKLTEQQVIELRSLWSAGMYQVELGARFGITQTAVSCIVNRKSWKHLPDVLSAPANPADARKAKRRDMDTGLEPTGSGHQDEKHDAD